jgi:5'-deoxynucleotidase YfbR-like HD superfamily hydrolase
MGTIIDVDFNLLEKIEHYKREEATPVTIEDIDALEDEIEATYKPLEKQKNEFAQFVKNQDIMSSVYAIEVENDKKVKKHNSIINRILKALNI